MREIPKQILGTPTRSAPLLQQDYSFSISLEQELGESVLDRESKGACTIKTGIDIIRTGVSPGVYTHTRFVDNMSVALIPGPTRLLGPSSL